LKNLESKWIRCANKILSFNQHSTGRTNGRNRTKEVLRIVMKVKEENWGKRSG